MPNHPLKAKLYDRAREYFLEATTLEQPPLEVVDVPFAGRPDEGDNIRFYLTRPGGVDRPRVVLAWGGIDTWKEESHARLGALLRARGLAVVLIDIPGTGESPVLASADAERQYTPVFDYLATRTDLDGSRCGVIGASFGGYWAMKLAYTHRDQRRRRGQLGRRSAHHLHARMAGALPQRHVLSDGPHGRLAPGSSAEARSRITSSAARSCRCSTRACSTPRHPRILLVNGRDDQQNSIDDLYLSLDHGDPKAARVFDGGHMGQGPTVPTIVDWMCAQLA